MLVAGLALLTAGFFAVHGVASGWVPARAHAGGVATGQAASLYLFTYYLGSSVFGSLAGPAWTRAAWPGVVALAPVLLLAHRRAVPRAAQNADPALIVTAGGAHGDPRPPCRRVLMNRDRIPDAFGGPRA